MKTVAVPFFRKEKERIVCEICPRECKLAEGQVGFCRGREVQNGVLIASNYGQVATIAIDPIEKKPLYHVYPGSRILSLGPNGCNLNCDFCQNWQISQDTVPTREITIPELLRIATSDGSVGVAYTYSEPLMWYEYLRDSAAVIKEKGLITVVVTNGYICEKPLRELLPRIDAMNIDLKSIDPEFYRKLCGGNLEDVQRTIRISLQEGCHIELTHLIVTGQNDDIEKIRRLVQWIASVDTDIPLHLSRYFPHHRYLAPSTGSGFMNDAYQLARQFLNFVYVGNISVEGTSDTICPNCGTTAIQRDGYYVKVLDLISGNCVKCGRSLNMLVKS
jgi:pyruvate formate lyase activating enzyme